MTAITTVPAHRRLARLTPYLLAVVAAVAVWLLLGTHAAFASERPASHPARGQHESIAASGAREARRPQEPRTHENTPPARHQSARTDGPDKADASERQGHAAPPLRRASVTASPLRAALFPKQAVQDPARTFSVTAAPGHQERQPEPRIATAPAARLVGIEPVTKGNRHNHGILFAQPTSHDDRDDTAPESRRQSAGGEPPQPARRDEPQTTIQPEAAPQVLSQIGCRPPAEEDRSPTAARPQVHRASRHGSATGLVRRPAHVFARQQGLALVATPSAALVPILSMRPPTIALPASGPALPANPSMPFQPSPGGASGPAPARAHPATVDATPLAARIQSAVTVGALALLVPLLAIVLLFQIRLMHLMRSLQAEPAQATTRYYSLTHEEVRELAPDMLPALAHHRFCESERHRGRWRPASWLELETTGEETPLMWSTCDTCHHQRMTRLRSGQEVALSPQ
jgi:hypothetical protein